MTTDAITITLWESLLHRAKELNWSVRILMGKIVLDHSGDGPKRLSTDSIATAMGYINGYAKGEDRAAKKPTFTHALVTPGDYSRAAVEFFTSYDEALNAMQDAEDRSSYSYITEVK